MALRELSGSVALIGCGRMGSALLTGWLGERSVHVLDPQGTPAGAIPLNDADELAALPRPLTIVIAVKPAIVGELLPALAAHAADDVVYLSIAAGVAIEALRTGLGPRARVIRAMPNTPASVLRGITALVADPAVDEAQRTDAQRLMAAVGEVVWLDDEAQMDAVTAISGSGPAYFFRLGEALADAGAELGLPADIAATLARATLAGAGALAGARPQSLADLRREVTSPNGTTAAALAVFDRDARLATLVRDAAEAAARRSRELRAGQHKTDTA